MYEWNWRVAEEQFKHGIELQPDYAEAHHWYAINLLTPLGRFDEAMEHMTKAQELERSSLVINATVGLVRYFARQIDVALEHFRRALDMNPDFAVSHFFMGQALVQKGHFQEALEYFQTALKLYGDSNNVLANYGYAAALAGERSIAYEVLQQLLAAQKQTYVSAYDIATVYCGLGDHEIALNYLEKAFAERAFLMIYLNVDPLMNSLQRQPRFRSLVERVFSST